MFQNLCETLANVATLAAVPVLGRTVAIFCYVGLSRQRSLGWRIGWWAAFGAAYYGLSSANIKAAFVLTDIALTVALLTGASLIVYVYAWLTRRGYRSIDAAVCLCLGLGAPLATFPREMWPLAGPLGWEFALSAYSYVRQYRQERSATLGDCLFFMIVSPLVVFPGHRIRVLGGSSELIRGFLRSVGGYASMGVGLLLPSALGVGGRSALVATVVFGLTAYALHSGRASVDVGVMRMLGYPVPERYRYPFQARDPQDFWTRWNVYVGDWAKEYLFFPCNRLGRMAGLSRIPSLVIAVVFTFTVVGLVHEFVALWSPKTRMFGYTAWFVCNGFLLLAWRAIPARFFEFRFVYHAFRAACFIGMAWAAKLVLG